MPRVLTHPVPANRQRRVLPVALMLGSGLGLLAIGAIGLWRSLQATRAQIEVFGAQESRRVAEGMRAALAQPAMLDRATNTARFTLRSGALVVPAAVGWVVEAPNGRDEAVGMAAANVIARLSAALEARDDAAVAELRRTIDTGSDSPRADAAVLLAASWFAQRKPDHVWRDALRARLRAMVAAEQLGDDVADRVVVSLALLAAHAGASEREDEASGLASTRLAEALGRMARASADAVLARWSELGAASDALAPLRAHVEAMHAYRATLTRVAPLVPQLASATQPSHLSLDTDLVLFFPAAGAGAASGDGEGCVLPTHATLTDLFAAARSGSSVDGIALSFAATLAAGASSVVAGVAAVAPTGSTAPAAPWLLASLLVALALLFTGALVTTLRGVRQQALAQAVRAEFLTSVTHELKTPLSSLRLLSELLAGGRVQEGAQQKVYHDLIAGETARLCALVDNVLDLGRTERGERGFDMQPVEVGELVSDTLALLAPLAARDGVRVHREEHSPGVLVRGDRAALTQALLNVLDNARKYGARKYGKSDAGIRVRVDTDTNEARIVVRDFGPGVPQAERERIFDKFGRGHAQADGHQPGLGLGLYLARAIVRAHGGDLTLRTPADGRGGAEFVLALPRTQENA